MKFETREIISSETKAVPYISESNQVKLDNVSLPVDNWKLGLHISTKIGDETL